MKKILYFLLGLTAAVALSSCVKEPEANGVADPALGGIPVQVTFNLDLGPGMTKAAPETSGLDDGSAVDQVYAAIFAKDGSLISTSRIGGTGFQPTLSISGGSATVTLTLSRSQDYRVVFFAQKQGMYDVQFAPGNVATFSPRSGALANDPARDAFWAAVDVKSSVSTYSVSLRRPFAQVNVLVPAGDLPAGKTTFSSTMTVKGAAAGFDLFTGKSLASTTQTTYSERAIAAPAFGKYASGYRWVAMNYVLVPESGRIDLTFKEKDMAAPISVTGVPVQMNARTNLVGPLYRGGSDVEASFEVVIDPGLGGEGEDDEGQGGGGGGNTTETSATLTNAEIQAATVDASMTDDSTHYGDGTITGASGTWTGNFAHNRDGLKYLQLRNKKGAYLTSPVFSSNIEKIVVTVSSDESLTLYNRVLYAIPPTTAVPTGDDPYTAELWADKYGAADTGTTRGAKLTLEFTGETKQFTLVVGGGAAYIDEITVYFQGGEPEGPDPVVTTGEASSVTTASATLSGSFSGMTDVRDYGFRWGTSSTALTNETGLNSSAKSADSFTATISSLDAGQTYYYQAYVVVYDSEKKATVEYTGAVKSFTTATGQGDGVYRPYMSNYEMPAIAFKDGSRYSSGDETHGYKWYSHETTNAKQKAVTHTYQYNGKVYRNYTCLVDGDKMAPLWSAFVMHADAYPDNNVGRSNGWKDDPAIASSWQQGGISSPYSRGHLVASNYRQVCDEANRQTFYHTNQAPQYQTSFNDGVWNSLEQAVKGNAPSGRDTLYVVVGLLYENSRTVEGVPVPSHFYKLLMKCSFDTSGAMTAAKGVAYLFTNEAHSGEKYTDTKFRFTIDEIEQRTGFNFFANVPSSLQDAAEAQSASLW